MRTNLRRTHQNEAGQALPLFVLFLFIFLGFCAMSIDVGRFVWARTSMQAGVDAAAIAAAQDMPNQTAAEATAAAYWADNAQFIINQGTNVALTVSYPPGNKRIRVAGEADIPTWFAKFFGVDEWHVSAEGDAEAQVLDIAVVFDISGSMCYDTFFFAENSTSYLMSPGRMSPTGGSFPVLAGDQNTAMAGTQTQVTATQTTIRLNDVSIFNSTNAATNRANFGTTWNTNQPYYLVPTGTSSGGNNDPGDEMWSSNTPRRGVIKIDNELMKITAVNAATNTLTVVRGYYNENANSDTSGAVHDNGDEVWANRTGHSSSGVAYCDKASRYQGSATQEGPHEPFDGAIDAAKYFTTLFNTSYDKIGAASYSTNTTLRENLTFTFSAVRDELDGIAYPDGSTNIAGGIAAGRLVLDGTGKRANAVRVLVLLTDGIANTVCGSTTYNANSYNNLPCSSTNSGTTAQSENHAYAEATRATNADIILFTIGLGDGVNENFLERVADGGVNGVGPCQDSEPGCRYYFAPTTDQLDEAFEAIAEQTHIALVR